MCLFTDFFFFIVVVSPRPCLNIEEDPDIHEKPFLSSSAPPITSLSLLGNFEVMFFETILRVEVFLKLDPRYNLYHLFMKKE